MRAVWAGDGPGRAGDGPGGPGTGRGQFSPRPRPVPRCGGKFFPQARPHPHFTWGIPGPSGPGRAGPPLQWG